MITLRPCPFCGAKAELAQMGNRRMSCIVSCTMCGCRSDSDDEGEHNGNTWNRRPGEDALIAACRDAREFISGGRLPSHYSNPYELIVRLRDAIAKATGEKP